MNKEQRQVCWLARDAYFACLDNLDNDSMNEKNEIQNLTTSKNSEPTLLSSTNLRRNNGCVVLEKAFRDVCPDSWVLFILSVVS